MKKNIIILLFFLSQFSRGQNGFTLNTSIPVIDSTHLLELAWSGGLNYPIFSEIDLNNDNISDLFVYDRDNSRILTFINNGGTGIHCWEYAPQYTKFFPAVEDWAILYDYNCDNKPDLFSRGFSNNGIRQYRNDSNGNNILFTLVDSSIHFSIGHPFLSNILASGYLVPNFNDIDGDGDMDIIGQQFQCAGAFAYYKNMSMEHYGTCDSLDDYFCEQNVWGEFALRNGAYENVAVAFWNLLCPVYSGIYNGNYPYEPARRDDTYANIFTIDIDGDGDKDALIGDSWANNSLLVVNGGDSTHAVMASQDTLFPSYDHSVHIHSFAMHAYVDADNDGIKDLLVSQREYENKKGVYFYKNTGTNAIPHFNFIMNNFLQNEMIDVGESATPVFCDYNGDGLKDIIIGNKYITTSDSTNKSGLTLYKNTGTFSSPSFEFITDDFAGLNSLHLAGQLYPAFGDLDGDNDLDMVLGLDDGRLIYFSNIAGPGLPMSFAAPVYSYMSIDVGQSSTPQLFDLNKDGLLDFVIGGKNGLLKYFENAGTPGLPFFSSTPTIDSLGGTGMVMHLQNSGTPDGYSVPFLFNQGGSTRLLVSCMKGDIYLYGNIDGNLTGSFSFLDTVLTQTVGVRYLNNLTVSGGDLNNDSLVDMVVGLYGGGLQIFYQNDSTNVVLAPGKPDLIRVLPNPVSETLLIKSLSTFENLNCVLFDITGRTILTQRLRGDFTTIDVSDITPGIYFLRVTSGKINVTKKIIVER